MMPKLDLSKHPMKTMSVVFGVVFALLGAPLVASAAPSTVTVQQVNTLLDAWEYAPTAADWKKVGPEAEEVLRNTITNKKLLVVKRARAASSLLHFKTKTSKAALTTLVGDAKAPRLLRGKAARVLADSYGDAALPIVQPLLAHDHKRLREAVIKALISMRSQQADAVLSTRLKSEPAAYLRTIILKNIKRSK